MFRRQKARVAPPLPRKWVHYTVVLRWPALVLGLLLIGAATTYLVAPPAADEGMVVQARPDRLDQGAAVPIPSLLGLDRGVAVAALGDAGLANRTVTYTDRPAAGPVGLVLEQNPAPGTSASITIALTVSSATPVPIVIGTDVAAARTELERLGAVVRVDREITTAAPRNQVLTVDPAEGATMPTVVTLKVADPGDALSLSAVSPVESSSCSSTDQVTVNGRISGPSVECSSGTSVAYAEYTLGRHAVGLEAMAGTNDREGTGGAEIIIFGDGRELARVGVGLGNSVPVVADLRGVLRLRIEVRTAETKNAPDVVLADAKLVGPTAGLNVIAGDN